MLRYSITPHESRRELFVIFLNEEPWKEIHRSIYGKHPRLDIQENDLDAFTRKFLEVELQLAQTFSLRRLAQKNYSSFEMEKLLGDRLVSRESIAKVLKKLQEYGYINDKEWINAYIHRQREKKQGPRSITLKLKAKGLPDTMIKHSLSESNAGHSQSDAIKGLLQTKYRKHDLSDFKQKQKVIGALLRRGFDYEEISSVFSEISHY